MANLSNINNKFIVTDGGQTLVNQTVAGFNPDADDLIVGNLSGNTGITIASGPNAGNYGSIYFADAAGSSTASKAGYIRYEQNTSEMTIGINAVEKIAIALNGDTTFSGSITAAGGTMTADTTFNSNIILEGNIFHKDDTNTYFGFNPGTSTDDTIVFATTNVKRLVINPGGVVTVGTAKRYVDSSNTQFDLEVTEGMAFGGSAFTFATIQGDSAGNGNIEICANAYPANTGTEAKITFKTATSGGGQYDDALVIKGPNIGIGTDSPRYQLDLAKANSSQADYIALGVNNGNTAGTGTALGSGLIWKANYTSYTKRSAGIVQIAQGSYFRSALAFYTNGTADAGTDWSERMRIDMDGNVGIGTTSPSNALTIYGSSTGGFLYPSIKGITKIGVTDYTLFLMEQYGGNEGFLGLYFDNIKKIQLRSNGDSYFNGGNVGIGMSPSTDAKLEILNGNIRVRGSSANSIMLSTTGGATRAALGNAGNEGDLSLWRSNNIKTVFISSYYDGYINNTTKKFGFGTTTPTTKLDVHGTTGTRNRNTTSGETSSVFETSRYYGVAGNATTNVSIDTSVAFPPMASGGYILVEVSAAGYGSGGTNGLIFSYITGGYGGHYAALNAAYHPVTIIVNTMQNGTCTWYNPDVATIGITIANGSSTGVTGVMRVKVTTTY